MNDVIIEEITYEKLIPLNIGKYEYLFLMRDNKIYYAVDNNGSYVFPNQDLTLKGNANMPLSDLNGRIIMNHIKDILEKENNGLDIDKNMIINKLNQMQRVLQNNELYILFKGSVNELSNFDIEVSKMLEKFDDLYHGLTGYVVKKEDIVMVSEEAPKKDKILDENANVDTIMIAMLANIGILLFIMLILNIIR
jgi:hypothetical protein